MHEHVDWLLTFSKSFNICGENCGVMIESRLEFSCLITKAGLVLFDQHGHVGWASRRGHVLPLLLLNQIKIEECLLK
jgi:hypothetical protein